MSKYSKTVEYFLTDFSRTLFPLETNRILIEHSSEKLAEFIYQQITHKKESQQQFLFQVRADAAKPNFHLRRTFKLDPIAEFFLYDLTYRNRTVFRDVPLNHRKNFGYRFNQGKMISPAQSYRDFRLAVYKGSQRFTYGIKVDIAQYFNSLYHHDLIEWFNGVTKNKDDVDFLDKFLRQINGGRSIDCLPQGIYPTKIIGSQFLRFLDESNRLRASQILRFMDDIYLFDNDYGVLLRDFYQMQRLLGQKSLTVNSAKTQLGRVNELHIELEIDEIKSNLLDQRVRVIFGSGVEEESDQVEERPLTEEEVEYLLGLLNNPHLEEDDAELILALMREHSDDVLGQIPTLLRKFPSLSKNFYFFAQHVQDKTTLLNYIRDFVRETVFVPEFQLFWLSKVVETQLLKVEGVDEVLSLLYEHTSATDISKAKILEIPEQRFGMPNLREEQLRTGASGWLAWSAAVGSRNASKATRNHLLGYFAHGGPINQLVAQCVKKL